MSTKKKHTDYLTIIKENLHKLEIGKLYKFTELCRTLGLEVPNGKNPKIALLKALDGLVVRVEEGKKHIITEIRETQVEIIDNRGKNPSSHGNNGVYSKEIGATLLHKMLQNAFSEDSNILH